MAFSIGSWRWSPVLNNYDRSLYVWERLAQRNYRRLVAFKPDRTARFDSWLRAGVRNLCFAHLWRPMFTCSPEFRPRYYHSVLRLPWSHSSSFFLMWWSPFRLGRTVG